jgi:membrane protease YdiL (CAAX protease family)
MAEQPVPSRSTRTWAVLLVFLATVLTAGVLSFLAPFAAHAIGLSWSRARRLPELVSAAVSIAAVVMVTRPWDSVRLGLVKGRETAPQLLALIVGGLALFLAVGDLGQLLRPADDEFMSRHRMFQRSLDTNAALAWSLFSVGLVSSAAQEIFYRGYMQTQLRAVWGRASAIAIVSLCFGLAHVGQSDFYYYGLLDLRWGIPVGVTIVASLYYGWVREVTGGVGAAAACHAAWNATAVLQPFGRIYALFWSDLWWCAFLLAVFVGCMWYLMDELPLSGSTAHD